MRLRIEGGGLSAGIVVLGLTMGLAAPGGARAEKLPVFKLAAPRVDEGRATGILNKLGGTRVAMIQKVDRSDALVRSRGAMQVEISSASGGIFMRDAERLWDSTAKPMLPSKEQARGIADKFLAENALLPAAGAHHKVTPDGFGETALAEEVDGKVQTRVLDVQPSYKVDVSVKDAKGRARSFPIVGGGGKFRVAVGDRGSVIGYHGVWRPVETVASYEEIVPQASAIAQFRKSVGNVPLTKTEAYLAYYQAPSFESQSFMAPVWVVKAEMRVGNRTVPMRNTIIAATKYGPERKPVVPPTARPKDARPEPRSLDQDEKAGSSMLDLVVPPVHASPGYEAGTSWLYTESGLPGCKDVGNGFVNKLSAAGWHTNFNWGGHNAFESDWRRNDDTWVDAADFVLYCGHADMNGWVLHSPDDGSLDHTEVGAIPGNPNDLYGQNDAEWIVIAACGPLEDSHFVTGGGNAFDRWRGAFDGLHALLGYGAVTFDNTQEGSRLAQLTLGGWKVIDAWFRTAWEIQPSSNGYGAPYGPNVYVAAMYAHMGDNATRHDHIWGKGSVAPDPVGPGQRRVLMWQRT